ncbi:MAG: hypothetical protein ABW153_09225 [Sedimenticola sp.]
MKKNVCIITTSAMLFFGGATIAGERLDNEALKAFYTDRTTIAENHKYGSVKTYFAADGTITSIGSDSKRVGKWWIDGDKRCVQWNNKKKAFCHYTEKNEDGTHTLVHFKNGKRLVEIKDNPEGNQL